MAISDVTKTRLRSWTPIWVGIGGLFIAWGSLAFPLGGLIVVLYGVCCLVFSIRRWWQGDRRLGWAIVTSLLVFVMTMAVSWQVASLNDMEAPGHAVHRWLYGAQLRRLIEDYHQENGVYPNSLGALAIPASDVEWTQDSWLHPFFYERTESGYRLMTLGRDGVPGGAGLDADLELTHDERHLARSHEVRIPLRQFLFECYGASRVWGMAALGAILAGCVWFLCPVNQGDVSSGVDLTMNRVVYVAFILVPTIAVAVFLAMFHLAAEKSGH